jgi:hypothetical protein
MTVAAKIATISYYEDGATTAFAVPFRFRSAADLQVDRIADGVRQRLTLGIDYSVAGGETDAGGTITRTAATIGAVLRIRRRTARAQPMTYTTGDRFPANSHEEALDRAILISQEQDADSEELNARSVMVPEGEMAPVLAPASQRIGGNKVLAPNPVDGAIEVVDIGDRFKGDPGGNAMAIGLFTAAGTMAIEAGYDLVQTSGWSRVGVGQALYAFDPLIDAAYVATHLRTAFIDANGRGFRFAGRTLDAFQVGAKGSGADDTAAIVALFAECEARDLQWRVPVGQYVVDHDAPIRIRTGGRCDGVFLMPKTSPCRFEIVRDQPGIILPTDGWDPLLRGKTEAGAINAFRKNLFIASSEILTHRYNGGYPTSPYYKQEFIRCRYALGNFTTALVHSYSSLSNVTVTAHDPSSPIIISGLRVHRTGVGTPVERGSIVVWRDNVILDQPAVINDDPRDALSFAMEIGYCADVSVKNPVARGVNAPGLGYGIVATATIGLTIYDAEFGDCRHGFSGAYNVDCRIVGGTWAYVIDDHWFDRFTIENPRILAEIGSAGIQVAGRDLTVISPSQFGGRCVVGLRTDTPTLGGKVIIANPTLTTLDGSSDAYIFGFTSPAGPGVLPGFTTKPALPDTLVVDTPTILTSGAPVCYGIYLGMMEVPHTTWGTVELRGHFEANKPILGVFAICDGRYMQDRDPMIVVDSATDYLGGSAVYVTAVGDNVSRRFDVHIRNARAANLRFSPYGIRTVKVDGGAIANVENDDNSEAWTDQLLTFTGVTMLGGVVRDSFKNISFKACTFSGEYTNFPGASAVTMLSNDRTGPAGQLPPNIRTNVVAPFA